MEASDGIAASSDERGEGSEEEFEALDIVSLFIYFFFFGFDVS